MLSKWRSPDLWRLAGLIVTLLLCGCEPSEKQLPKLDQNATKTPFEIDQTLCDFNQKTCDRELSGQRISLAISPENTPSEKPLQVTLTSSVALEELSVRVEGRDMFMGVIPVKLSQTGKNTYQGPLIYGSCSSDYMVWRLIASFKIQGEAKVVMFDFLADS
ncbi:hypothetical protein [Shewanella sp.]|uniref:hypothetical protein n=1 Tax=Shewanella sp. TaxID=50422 RepID=UPI003D0EA18C